MAWLRAAPGEAKKSRIATRTETGLSVDWPDIAGVETVAEYLAELGHAHAGDNGLSPVSFVEIEAWARLTGLNLSSWLAILLRELSKEYAHQANTSGDANCPPPYQMVATEIDLVTVRAEADKKVRALFDNG